MTHEDHDFLPNGTAEWSPEGTRRYRTETGQLLFTLDPKTHGRVPVRLTVIGHELAISASLTGRDIAVLAALLQASAREPGPAESWDPTPLDHLSGTIEILESRDDEADNELAEIFRGIEAGIHHDIAQLETERDLLRHTTDVLAAYSERVANRLYQHWDNDIVNVAAQLQAAAHRAKANSRDQNTADNDPEAQA